MKVSDLQVPRDDDDVKVLIRRAEANATKVDVTLHVNYSRPSPPAEIAESDIEI